MTTPGMFDDIPQNIWRHSPEYNIPPIPRVPRIPFPIPLLVLYIAYDKRVFFPVIPVCIITPGYGQDYDVHSLHCYCATLTQAKLFILPCRMN